jgi:hypothetical protein
LAIPRASGPVFLFCVPDSFSAVPWASGPVFMFFAPGLVFGGTEGVGSLFHLLRSRTRFRRYRGRRVPFSSFALQNSFSVVPRASLPVFLFYALGLIFGGSDGVGSRFHVLRARTHFRRTEGIGCHFHVLSARTHFHVFGVPRASGVGSCFMFCAPGLIFNASVGVGSRFHVLRPDSFSSITRA